MSDVEHSAAFQRFLDSFAVVDRESSEDYDIEALMQLSADERVAAETLLIETVEQSDDPRAPRALRYVRSERAVPALRQAVATRDGEMLVQSALALHELTGDESAVEPIVRTLREGEPWARVDAASVLGAFALPAVEAALFDALDDPDRLVRANAVESLLGLSGLAAWETVPGRGISLLGLRLRSRFVSVRHEAIAELRRLVDAKRAGRTAAELGILVDDASRSDAALALQRSFAGRPGAEPFAEDIDLDALLDIDDPAEREWAEYSLLFLLDKGDPRAARALLTMRSERAVEPLREVIADATGLLAVEAAWALWLLAGDDLGVPVVEAQAAAGTDEVRRRVGEVLRGIGASRPPAPDR